MIENDRIYLNVVNDADRPVETLCQIYNEVQEWVEVLLPVLGKAVLGALGLPAVRQKKRSVASQKKRSAVTQKKRSAVSQKKRSPKKRTGSTARP